MTSAELMMLIILHCQGNTFLGAACPKAIFQCYTINTARQYVFDSKNKKSIEMIIQTALSKESVLVDCLADPNWRWKK